MLTFAILSLLFTTLLFVCPTNIISIVWLLCAVICICLQFTSVVYTYKTKYKLVDAASDENGAKYYMHNNEYYISTNKTVEFAFKPFYKCTYEKVELPQKIKESTSLSFT